MLLYRGKMTSCVLEGELCCLERTCDLLLRIPKALTKCPAIRVCQRTARRRKCPQRKSRRKHMSPHFRCVCSPTLQWSVRAFSCPHFPRIQPCPPLVLSPSRPISVLHLVSEALVETTINPHFSRFQGVHLRFSLHFPRTPYLDVH